MVTSNNGSGGGGGGRVGPKAGGAAAAAGLANPAGGRKVWTQREMARLGFAIMQTPIGLIPGEGELGKSANFHKTHFWRDVAKSVGTKGAARCEADCFLRCPGATYLSRGASQPVLRQGVLPREWRRRQAALELKSVEDPIALRTAGAEKQLAMARMMDLEDHVHRDHEFMEREAERIKRSTKELRVKHDRAFRRTRSEERKFCMQNAAGRFALTATQKTGPVPVGARLHLACGARKELPDLPKGGYLTNYSPAEERCLGPRPEPKVWAQARRVQVGSQTVPFWGAGSGRLGKDPDSGTAAPGLQDPFMGDREPGVVGRGGFTRSGDTGPRVPWELYDWEPPSAEEQT